MNSHITYPVITAPAQSASDRMAGDRLVAELEHLGLRYLSRDPLPEPITPLATELLVVGLASSPEARLHVALVPLPDLFAAALDLPPMEEPAARLAAVAARHAQLSGEPLNWLGTYEHAANSFMRFAEPLPV